MKISRGTLAAAALAASLVLAACAAPPPALPTKILDSGAKGLSKKHPKLTEKQLADCRSCHRAADAP